MKIIKYHLFVVPITDCPEAVKQELLCDGVYLTKDNTNGLMVTIWNEDSFLVQMQAVHKSRVNVKLSYLDKNDKVIQIVRDIKCIALHGIIPFVLDPIISIRQWGFFNIEENDEHSKII